MKNIVYFKTCHDENEYKNMQPYKVTKCKLVDRIIEKIYHLKFKIMTKYNLIKAINYNDKEMYFIFCRELVNEEKLLHKINQKVKQIPHENINIKIILSKQIKQLIRKDISIKNIDKLKNILQNSIEDKRIYMDFANEVVMSVIKSKKEVPEEQSIYILLNSNNIKYMNWINKIISNYKMINIITQNTEKFKAFESNAEAEMQPISILNNKRKSIAKAKYIINIDFNYEDIIAYYINRTAIIFNISNTKIKNLSNFDGIIINNINIEKSNQEFDLKDEYIENNADRDEILEDIENYMYELEGNNGKIEINELLNSF